MAINDEQFANLVLLIVSDKLGERAVMTWEAEWGIGPILFERKYLADPNDAARCAVYIAEKVAEFVAASRGEAA